MQLYAYIPHLSWLYTSHCSYYTDAVPYVFLHTGMNSYPVHHIIGFSLLTGITELSQYILHMLSYLGSYCLIMVLIALFRLLLPHLGDYCLILAIIMYFIGYYH